MSCWACEQFLKTAFRLLYHHYCAFLLRGHTQAWVKGHNDDDVTGDEDGNTGDGDVDKDGNDGDGDGDVDHKGDEDED